MRELQLWDAEMGVDEAFPDITALALRCRFGNCGHSNEPGCAVRAAREGGELAGDRWASYHKLKAEQAAETRKHDKTAAASTQAHWKKVNTGTRTRRKFEQEP